MDKRDSPKRSLDEILLLLLGNDLEWGNPKLRYISFVGGCSVDALNVVVYSRSSVCCCLFHDHPAKATSSILRNGCCK
jgi:hypothetical protein